MLFCFSVYRLLIIVSYSNQSFLSVFQVVSIFQEHITELGKMTDAMSGDAANKDNSHLSSSPVLETQALTLS